MISTRVSGSERWIALDVGGANIKVAHEAGTALTVPFEVWKRPNELCRTISAAVSDLPPGDHAALTMTAELCDCFPTKSVGVNAVLDAVLDALPGQTVAVWGVDGEFHRVADIRREPLLGAAANWLALATFAARLIPGLRGVLIDIGSTTTDLVPLDRGRVAARGRSDTERLQLGELVYVGTRRTPVCALATELSFRGVPTGLAAETFASTLDVYLTLGDMPPDELDLSTADGRPATVSYARDRLARMVGTDREGFSADDALAFAQEADCCLMRRLRLAAERAYQPTIGRPAAAIVAGSGEFLARRLAQQIIEPGGRIIGLTEAWGSVASSAGCAYALAILASERSRSVTAGDSGAPVDTLLEIKPP
jgi:(4-(4-[2-(gamma-L-glutamylamino)ethyl]phenoxymethyl)furan-2-yl)methanamine synthase